MSEYTNDIHDDYKESHPSYAVVGFSRLHTSMMDLGDCPLLFGASVPQNTTIVLRIKRAELHRSLASNSYYGKESLIEVEMTPHQFSELLTSMSVGDGVPCTIRRLGRERVPDPPQYDVVKRHEGEFETAIRGLRDKVKQLNTEARARLDDPKPLTKADRAMIDKALRLVGEWLGDTLPFIEKQFRVAADKTVAEVRSEIDAALTHFIQQKGLSAIADDVSKRIASSSPAQSVEMLPSPPERAAFGG